jgi:hypothetical protein
MRSDVAGCAPAWAPVPDASTRSESARSIALRM